MFQWLKRRKPSVATETGREALLNDGLFLAMEWGEDWLKPIQGRLAKRYPALTSHELDEINSLCQAAMHFGHEQVYELALAQGKQTSPEQFYPLMRVRYAWVNQANLSRLFSQGMYYAWKDTGLA